MFPTHFVFNHFPKAGGTSFFAVCRHNIPEAEISPQLMEDEIRLVRPERFESYRLIRGHFSVLTQMGFSRQRYSMTLLRHPIQTILSTYNFWRTRPEEDALTGQAKTMSFAEFVRRYGDSPSIIHNPYTHHFAAFSREYPGEAEDEELLAAAKHNLAAFDFVGICERLEDSVRLLCQETGWRLPARIPHENRSGRAHAPGSLDAETEQVLRQRNRLDLRLYAYAAELFGTRLQAMQAAAQGERGRARNRLVAFAPPPAARRKASIQQVRASHRRNAQLTSVTVSYETVEPMAELTIGITIHNQDGDMVYGPVAQLDRPGPSVPGTRQVTFEVKRALSPQTYSVSAGLEYAGIPGLRYDWVDRAAVFSVEAPPRMEFWAKRAANRAGKLIFGPFSRPVWRRLQAHLQPVEEKLGLVEQATAGLRDRVVELGEVVARLSEQQKQLLQRFDRASESGAAEKPGAATSNDQGEARRTADGAGS